MSKLKNNIIYNFAGQAILLLLGIITVKAIYHQLGKEILGIIYFTQFITLLIIVLFDKSIKFSIVREISSNITTNQSYACDLIQTLSFVCWSAFWVLELLLYFSSPVIVNNWINISTVPPDISVSLLRILGTSSLLTLLRSSYNSILSGLEQMKINNIIDVIIQGIQIIGILLIIKFGGTSLQVSYWILICGLISIISFFIAAWRLIGLQALIPCYSAKVIKHNMSFNIKLIAAAAFSTIYRNIDRIIISKLLPIDVVGQYGIISVITSKANMVVESILKASYPFICATFSNKDSGKTTQLYQKFHNIVCVISIPCVTFIWFISMPILTYLFGKQTANLLLVPYFFLLMGYYFSTIVTTPWLFSLAAGKPEITTQANFLVILIFTPLTLFFIIFLKLNGAGLAWMLYNLFYFLYAVPQICKQCLNILPKQWFIHWNKVTLPLVTPYVISWSVLWLFNALSVSYFITAYLIATIAFLFMSWKTINKEFNFALSKFTIK